MSQHPLFIAYLTVAVIDYNREKIFGDNDFDDLSTILFSAFQRLIPEINFDLGDVI